MAETLRFPSGYVPAKADVPEYIGLRNMPAQQAAGLEMGKPYFEAAEKMREKDDETRQAEQFKKVLEMGQTGMYQYAKELEPVYPELSQRLKAQIDGYTPLFKMPKANPKDYQDFMLDFYDNAEKQRNAIDATKSKKDTENLRFNNKVEFEKIRQKDRIELERIKASLFERFKKTDNPEDYRLTMEESTAWLEKIEEGIKTETAVLNDPDASYTERKVATARIKEYEDEKPRITAARWKASQKGAKPPKKKDDTPQPPVPPPTPPGRRKYKIVKVE